MAETLYDFCIKKDEFELLVQWDKQKNDALTPHDITKGSHRKVWWVCPFGHSWQAAVYTRTGQQSGCPYCTGRKLLPSEKTLAAAAPDLAKEWHPTKNGDLSPEDVAPGTHRKVWWKCARGHEWKAQIKSRVNGTGCPICKNRRVLPGENDLATTHPEIAAQWHPTKNGTRTPQSVVAGHYAKVWWQCGKGHAWQATVISRTASGNGCPICAGKTVIPGANDLASAYPAIAAQWHPTKNGQLKPEQVTPFSNKKVWWICEKGHAYYSLISHRVQNASGCPYCSNRRVLEGFNDLATTDPEVAKQWHPDLNGELTPQMVTGGSGKKVWWQCPEGHVWKAIIHSRAGPQKCGCPVCAGKAKSTSQRRYAEIISLNQSEKAAEFQQTSAFTAPFNCNHGKTD